MHLVSCFTAAYDHLKSVAPIVLAGATIQPLRIALPWVRLAMEHAAIVSGTRMRVVAPIVSTNSLTFHTY
jgi:hypothetical protein